MFPEVVARLRAKVAGFSMCFCKVMWMVWWVVLVLVGEVGYFFRVVRVARGVLLRQTGMKK